MNEIRLGKDTVLHLGPGVVWDERDRYVLARRGRGAWGTAVWRAAACLGGLVFVTALSGAAFVMGTSVGAGMTGPLFAEAAEPPRAESPPARAASAAADPNDPFGLRR